MGPEQDQALVSSITYLASLASTHDVDAKLDTMREITSRWQPDTPLVEQDRQALQKLERDLKYYLIHQDPLRDFTEQTLEQRLQARVGGAKKSPRLNYMLLVALSFVAPVIAAVLPLNLSLSGRLLLAIPIFFVSISTEIIWVYLSALRNFKPELRRVFVYQSVAAATMALALSVYVPLQLFDWGKLPVFQYGGLPEGGAVCMAFLYLAQRRYAKLLGVQGWFMSLPILVTSLAGAVLLGALVPSIAQVEHEIYFRMSVAGMFVLATLCAFGAATTWVMLHKVTPAYTKSLWVLFAFLTMCCIFGTIFAGYLLLVGELFATNLTYIMVPSAGPPMLLFLYCAYSFKKETSR